MKEKKIKKFKFKMNQTDYEILNIVLKSNKVSRIDLSRTLKLTPPAISKAVEKLLVNKLIVEKHAVTPGKTGRPKIYLNINKDYKKIIGVNLGVGFIKIAVSDMNGDIIRINTTKFSLKTRESLLNLLKKEIKKQCMEYGINNIIGIGVATHGMVDSNTGTVIISPHFQWRHVELEKELKECFGIPVVVENDVRSMIHGEYRYGNVKSDNCLLLYIKNGIGGAIYIDNKIYKGSNMSSGEIGHYIVNSKSTVKCRCGKFGCLETEHSEFAIINKIQSIIENSENSKNVNDLKIEGLNIETVYKQAKIKQEPYYTVVKESATEIGKVTGNILNVLDVNTVVLSGNVLITGDIFIKNFREGLRSMLLDEFSKNINVVASNLGEDIGVYGAVSLIINNLFVGKQLIKD